jgi:hypothetical protein
VHRLLIANCVATANERTDNDFATVSTRFHARFNFVADIIRDFLTPIFYMCFNVRLVCKCAYQTFIDEELQIIMHKHLVCTLAHKTYIETHVKDWCKEISNNIRDEVKTRMEACGHSRKVVVSTFIGSCDTVSDKETVHVSVCNERNSNSDTFVTSAMQSDTLHAWVTVLVV